MKTVAFTFLFFLSNSFFAQIYFKNNYHEPVFVAFAYYHDSKNLKGWQSLGWFKAVPGEKIKLLTYNPTNRNIYYYAQTEKGKPFVGQNAFIVDPKKPFSIFNADKVYVLNENKGYKWFYFRWIDKGIVDAIRLSYTINFSH